MTRAQNPLDEHRAEELYVYSALQKSEGLPAARHEDNPDFRLQLGGTALGIELTRFHYDKGAAGSTEARDHPNLWTNTAATVPTQLDDLIREEEKKLPTHCRSCQEVWLLIYNLLGALEIDLHVTSPTYRTDFHRVYLFDGFVPPVRLRTERP